MIGADASILFGLLLALPDVLAAISLAWGHVAALDVRRVLGLSWAARRR
jgi:hypothetical protein